MADELKIYTPEVIADTPFPITGEDSTVESTSSSTQSTKGVYGSKVTAEKNFPLKMVAKELFSTAINTISKKILKTFEFAKSGAIQIGEYIHGLSGEIKISPDGIVAKNKDGNTTFALDGDTGNAIFSGDIRASTFATDYFNVDNKGNVIARSIKFTNTDYAIQADSAWYQTITPGAGNYVFSYTLVDNIEIDLNLENDLNVAFNLSLLCKLTIPLADQNKFYDLSSYVSIVEINEATGTWSTKSGIPIDIFGNSGNWGDIHIFGTMTYAGGIYSYEGISIRNRIKYSTFGLARLNAGKHKIRVLVLHSCSDSAGVARPDITIEDIKLYYFSLGSA